MVIVSGKQTSVVNKTVGITVVVLVVILCLSGFIWFRRKKSKSTAHTRYTADNIQTADTDNQDDLHYASVYYSSSKDQEVPLYSTVQSSHYQEQEEEVLHAAVKIQLPPAQTIQEDPSIIYKARRKRT
ncbi:uncharacterized protein LOC106024432 isoform X4 [Esox lucius]|uniref:uncharacterized protein LOC106024432 isoform X4 n=1 Tax=Esox lucius TaxID=8010 RepID=UPI001476F133|nr:uncharacterized protein LOC106024432 isoform X4 [Esox lucius]